MQSAITTNYSLTAWTWEVGFRVSNEQSRASFFNVIMSMLLTKVLASMLRPRVRVFQEGGVVFDAWRGGPSLHNRSDVCRSNLHMLSRQDNTAVRRSTAAKWAWETTVVQFHQRAKHFLISLI
eukprot:2887389-Amphidinium_carterae.2